MIAAEKAMQVITAALVPYVGRTMAEASLRMHCERLGIPRQGALAHADLERLMERLSGAMSVFVGDHTTERLMAAIRSGLDGGAAR